MKPIEELNISPLPWCGWWDEILDKDGCWVAKGANGDVETLENCTLLRAAPELYKCLREATIEMCRLCESCSGYPEYKCENKESQCFVRKWHAVLAKAAGEKE